jgi:tetratricopeptide (TPR) repeat protein
LDFFAGKTMSVEKKCWTVLIAILAFLPLAQSARAQIPPNSTAQSYTIHEDLLKCYQGLGKQAETEVEFRWLLAARPNNALLHYNYGYLLKNAGKFIPASVEYEKAAMYEGSNVDYVGQCGQMFAFNKNYTKAYQYLGKAMQMPGGEKYKGSFDSIRDFLQTIQNQKAQAALNRAGGKPGASGSAGKKPKDDDDD